MNTLEYKIIISKIRNAKQLKLKSLDLSRSQIDKLPDELFELSQLTYLSIRDNNISFIQESISNFNCQAKVYQAFRKNHIIIEIKGKENEKSKYLYSIRETFRKLHKPFPKMNIKQEVFYKNHWLDYLQLIKLEDRNKSYYHVDLDEDLPITKILNGYSNQTERESEILKRIESKVTDLNTIASNSNGLLKYTLTNSTKILYPSIFTLKPSTISTKKNSNLTTEYELRLYCQHPECIHPVGEKYRIIIPKKTLREIAPYYNTCLQLLKSTIPVVAKTVLLSKGLSGFFGNESYEIIKKYISEIPEIESTTKLRSYKPRAANEFEMQTIKDIIEKADPDKKWMKYLVKIESKSKILWVCPKHAEEYNYSDFNYQR